MSLHGKLTTIEDKTFYGIDYCPAKELHQQLKEVPECDYLVLHTGFQHLIGYDGAYSVSLEDIPERVKNVLVGDIHIRDVTKTRGGLCISPGPLHACNLAQDKEKVYFELVQAEGAHPVAHPVPFQRIIKRFKYHSGEEFIKQQLTPLKGTKPKPIVEVKYALEDIEAVTAVMSDFQEDFIIFMDPYRTQVELDIPDEVIYEESRLIDALPMAVDRKEDTELYDFMAELLDGDAMRAINNELDKVTINAKTD